MWGRIFFQLYKVGQETLKFGKNNRKNMKSPPFFGGKFFFFFRETFALKVLLWSMSNDFSGDLDECS